MFRKLILTAVLGIGTLTGLTMTPTTAEARPPVKYAHHGSHRRYEVLYQECGRWQIYGTYGGRDIAGRAAHELRCRGFAVKLERC